MAIRDDIVDWITSEVDTIGLAIDDDGPVEVSGNGYTRLAPDYSESDGGSADLEDPLEFDGPENAGPVAFFLLIRDNAIWVAVPIDTPASFNSDGRIDLTSAPVTADLAHLS